MKSKVTILITAWARHIRRCKYLEESLSSISENLITTDIEPEFIITAETQNAKFQNKLLELANKYKYKVLFHPGRANLGANLNFAHRNIKTDYIIYVQDDFTMLKKHNPTEEIEFIKTNPQFSLIYYIKRFWDAGYNKQNTQNPRYLEVLKNNINYYSDNVHIKKGNFHNSKLYSEVPACEGSMNAICKADKSLHIATRLEDDNIPIFKHRGGAVPAMLEKYVSRKTLSQKQMNEYLEETE